MDDTRSKINCLTGPAAVPRLNGEILFDAPWEARMFGTAVGLHEHGYYNWSMFQQALIDAIQNGDTETPYYESWLQALESVVLKLNLVTADEFEGRVADYLEGRRTEVF